MKSLTQNLKQRTHIRHTIPAVASIDNARYQVKNWSLGGLCLDKFDRQVRVGDCFSFQFCLNLQQGIDISLKTLIEIVWQSRTQKQLGAKFLNLTQLERDLLQQAIADSDAEKTVTTKVLPAALLKDPPPTADVDERNLPEPSPRPSKKFNYKLLISTVAYLTVGSLLGGAALVSVYDATRSLKVKSASISDTVEPVVSINDGILSKVYVRPGEKVQADRPLVQTFNNAAIEREITNINATVRDKTSELEDLTRQIELSRLDLAEAQSAQRKNAALRQQELLELNSYGAIARSNLDSARAKVKSLEVQQQTTAENVKRQGSLLNEGAVSQQTYDEKQAELAVLDAELITAREAVNIARTSLESLPSGKFYNGNNLIGNLSAIDAEAIELQEQAKLASRKIATFTKAQQRQEGELQKLQQQKSNLENVRFDRNSPAEIDIPATVYQAPISGTVVRVAKSFGNTVNRGETLILLRPDNDETTIDAYLTQDQASLIDVGSPATVIIPVSGKQYQAQVVEIDRTGGFKDDVKGKYSLEGSEEQPAYVKLALTNIDLEPTEQLTGGTPVRLEFVKPPLMPKLKAQISRMIK